MFPTITCLASRLIGGMDRKNQAKLEEIRVRTPRSLFRAWNSRSGGDERLNTIARIMPLAFLEEEGHQSPYGLTFVQFKSMAHSHLKHSKDFATEFSSWSQSISLVLGFISNPEYISVIDTQELHETNPAYYVPLLPIHPEGTFPYSHEYLVHGVIKGPAHRAIPYQSFYQLSLAPDRFSWGLGIPVQERVTADLVQRCRSLGRQYGEKFALAVALALISGATITRDSTRDLRKSPDEIAHVARGTDSMHMPRLWMMDESILKNVVYVESRSDVRQFIRLMTCCAAGGKAWLERNQDIPQSESHQLTPYEEDQADDKTIKPIENVLLSSPRRPRGRKPVARRTRPVTRAVTRREELREEKRFVRTMKKLRIDMNRNGKKAHGGKDEGGKGGDDTEMGNT